MSVTTSHRQRRHNEESAPETAPPAPENTDGNGLDTSTALTSTITINDLSVVVPVRFSAGHVVSVNEAKVLQAAYERQYANNMNANCKARAERLAKAMAANDASAIAANTPLTAEEIAAGFNTYEPAIGGTPRQSALEKMKIDAIWRAWVQLVSEHNASAKAGGPPLIPAAKDANGVAVEADVGFSAPRKTKDMSEDAHKALVDDVAAQKAAFMEAFASRPRYADRIQAQLDLLMAERGTKDDAKGPAAVKASVNLLDDD